MVLLPRGLISEPLLYMVRDWYVLKPHNHKIGITFQRCVVTKYFGTIYVY